ncbi:unnamed protein product [Triticum turgidum subsp. durum]|uniref:KIB1-4 beta-propeller domain-containing protein n=1 Tax=Triticum turgidum subsp. durum TaxID=4567 RepID=A0A9R0TJF5_TRITD|nr:unnamed protein product [Triticum turgidum subsp. durum]
MTAIVGCLVSKSRSVCCGLPVASKTIWASGWNGNTGGLIQTVHCFPRRQNPVLHNGLMYLLGEEGGLAVYDVSRHDGNFEILDKPNSFGFECEDSYLVESDQHELMAVLIGHRGTPVNIVKLNEHTMEWEKIENLERRSLFTGTLSTTMKETNIKWMQNKIFLPRFYDWPQTVLVDLVQRDGELAFVPNSRFSDTTVEDNYGTDIWTYELGQGEEAKEFWETEKVNYSIWVDFSSY